MKYSYKNILSITFPVMLSVMMEQLINITDAIFLGRVSEVDVGAAGIAGIYYLALYMLGFGFCIGLQVLIARYNGEKRYKLTGRTFFQGLWFLIILAVLLITLSNIFTPGLLKSVISSQEVLQSATTYITWRSWGLLFALPALSMRSFFIGIVKTRVMNINAIALIVTNITLNYLLIYGKAGFPAMGIKGAAIASTLSELVSLLVYFFFMILKTEKSKYGLYPIVDKHLLGNVCRISIWSMLHSLISVAPWFIFFVAVEHLGEMQLAIANIVRSVSTFFSVIVNAFAATTGSLVSNLIGAGEKNKVMTLCRKIVKLGYILGIPLLVLAIIFNRPILGIYSSNPVLITEAFLPFVVGITVFLFGLPGFVYLNAVSGTGNTRLAFIFQAATIVLYFIYLWIISTCFDAPLALYTAIEHLFVISLFIMSHLYMRRWNNNLYKEKRIKNELQKKQKTLLTE